MSYKTTDGETRITGPERPEWAGLSAYMGPVEGVPLRYQYSHLRSSRIMTKELVKYEAMSGWANLMYVLTDDIVSHYRSDMVHDVVKVSEMVDAVLEPYTAPNGHGHEMQVVGQELEFFYLTRPTGTLLWPLASFTSAADMRTMLRAATGGSGLKLGRDEFAFWVSLGQREGDRSWYWTAEALDLEDPSMS